MAFVLSQLRGLMTLPPLSGGSEPGMVYGYKTNDTLAEVATSGYFNSATSILRLGDQIVVSGDLDGTPAINTYVVSSASGADTVTVTGFATVTQTYNSKYALTTTVTLTDGDSGYVAAPLGGDIAQIETVLLGGAVTTNDAVVTAKIGAAGAGVAVTGGVVTITASGSAIGDVDEATPSAANTVEEGDLIYFTVSGTPGGSRTALVSILIDAGS